MCLAGLISAIAVCLEDGAMEFGGLISTSNVFTGCATVTVNTDEPLLWSMGLDFHADI